MTRNSTWPAVLLVVALAPLNAEAQDTASFSTSLSTLSVGRRVTVTDTTGRSIKGTVTGVSADALTLGDRTFREAEVRRIRTAGDSLLNGTLIGGGIGLAAGALGSAGLAEDGDYSGVGPALAGGFLYGAGIGVLVDFFKGRPATVFDSTKTRARLIPMIGPRRGVLVSLRY